MRFKPDSLKTFVESIPCNSIAVLNESLMLCFGDILIALHSNSPKLIHKLAVYYEGFVCYSHDKPDIFIRALDLPPLYIDSDFIKKQPDPGKTKIKEEYLDFNDGRIIRKRLTGMLFAFGRDINIAAGNCIENTNQVINFINNRYIQFMLNRGYILGHAAAVNIKSMGIAIAGFAGAGKSTLCLHLMSKGASFTSNDRLLVKKENNTLKISGIAKLPRVNPGTILNNPCLENVIPAKERLVFEKMPQDDIWNLEHKYDVFINSVFGRGKFSLFGKMDILLILNWKRNNEPFEAREVDIEQRKDLLNAFIKSPGLFYKPEGVIDTEKVFSDKSYMDHLKLCRVFEFSGGVDFEKAADTCMGL